MTETSRAERTAAAVQNRDEPGSEIAPADPLRGMIDRWMPEIIKQFPIHLRANPDAWARVMLTGMRNSKQAKALARCDRPSLYAAMLEAARFGLTPFTDEAAIIPYGTTATFVPMAQGFVKMFYNTGQVSSVVVDFIRRGELKGRDWQISRGPGGQGFWHEPRYTDEEGNPVQRGEPILAYCYLEFKDGSSSQPAIVDRWTAEDVMRNHSKAWQNAEKYKKYDSLWHTDFNAMWLKTAVRRAAKYGPKSAELQELLLIEAREDHTRDDAPAPQITAPPMGEGAGIDWSADIAGGNVTQGTVVEDDPEAFNARVTAVFREHGLGAASQAAVRAAVVTGLYYKMLDEPVTVVPDVRELSAAELTALADNVAAFCDGLQVQETPDGKLSVKDQIIAYARHVWEQVNTPEQAEA